MAQMKHFDYDTRMKYYLPKFDNDSEIAYDPDVFTNALIDRATFTKFAAMCVNYDLQKKYGLMAQSDVIYCIRNYDNYFAKYGMDLSEYVFYVLIGPIEFTCNFSIFLPLDIYDYSFGALCAILLIIIVMSTLYDLHLKRKNLPHMNNREHYKRPVDRGRKY